MPVGQHAPYLWVARRKGAQRGLEKLFPFELRQTRSLVSDGNPAQANMQNSQTKHTTSMSLTSVM